MMVINMICVADGNPECNLLGNVTTDFSMRVEITTDDSWSVVLMILILYI